MTLQARLTLYYVLLAVLMAGIISAVNLSNETQAQFEATLERAQMLQSLAVVQLKQAVNRQPTTPLREALQDPDLVSLYKYIMLFSHFAILEIAVVDSNHDNEILLDSSPEQVWARSCPYITISSCCVGQTNWYQKLRALLGHRAITSWNRCRCRCLRPTKCHCAGGDRSRHDRADDIGPVLQEAGQVSRCTR